VAGCCGNRDDADGKDGAKQEPDECSAGSVAVAESETADAMPGGGERAAKLASAAEVLLLGYQDGASVSFVPLGPVCSGQLLVGLGGVVRESFAQ
jgi:hypothetical protein